MMRTLAGELLLQEDKKLPYTTALMVCTHAWAQTQAWTIGLQRNLLQNCKPWIYPIASE